MSEILKDFDKKNKTPKHKIGLADEITQALGINGVYVSVSLTNEEMHLNKLDFSGHDNRFKERIGLLTEKNEKLFDENKELKKRIAELESKGSVKPMRIEFHADNGEMLTPLEVANSLINQNTFKVDELKELAEILEVYHRHHRDKDKDIDDLW